MTTPDDDVICGSCGQPVAGEDPTGRYRIPCPNCGSFTRQIALEGHAICQTKVTAELSVTTYPQVLLSTAENLLLQGQFGISVVVAHMACEVATERTFSEAFSAKGISYLEECLRRFLNGNNLASDRTRELYIALTGDEVQRQPFWANFKASTTRRNAIVHEGRIVSRTDAEASLAAANALISHLRK